MSGERGNLGRGVSGRLAIGAMSLVIVGILALMVYVPNRSMQVMREFDNLWNTTDAIQVYVSQNHKWPRDWDALSSSFIAVGARSSYVRDAVVVNFDVDCEKPPQAGDWYVHLKSGAIPGEERTANERLRGHVVRLGGR